MSRYIREKSIQASSVDPETKGVADSDFGTVLVLYTGGTIGMKIKDTGVYLSERDYFYSWLQELPYFHSKSYAEEYTKKNKLPPFYEQFRCKPLFMPVIGGRGVRHLQYVVMEYSPLIDSSNMDFDIMLQIALDIKKYYKKFDAFVVLHGTDTMCYTAAALSFILENLGKTVILTGSQIPIYETRSDGRDNFQGALIMAAKFVIPEVCVFFDNHLLRGNRARKVSADTLDAFDSPNFPALGQLEVNVTVYWDLVQRPSTSKQFNVHTLLCQNVAILRIFPNISADVVRAFLRDPIQGVVMQCYGAGNFPDQNVELIECLREASARDVIIVNTTQCRRGSVSISYAGAKALLDAGVVAGFDMTSEAALAKLSYVLTKPWSIDEKRKFMSKNVVGELTSHSTLPKHHPLTSAFETLGFDLTGLGLGIHDVGELRETLVLPLMCFSIKNGDLDSLDRIVQNFPGNLLMADYDQRTALHIAVRDGSYDCVKYLIDQGAVIHAKDRFNRTPLLEAVYARRLDVIELLVRTGALINMHPETLAMKMNQAVTRGDIDLIKAFWSAGAKLEVWDYSRRTPLHMAVLNYSIDIIDYLLSHGANPWLEDDLGRNAFAMTCHLGVIEKLERSIDMKLWTKLRRKASSLSTASSASSVNMPGGVGSEAELAPKDVSANQDDDAASVETNVPQTVIFEVPSHD